MKATVERYNKTTGDLIGVIEAPLNSCSTDYDLYGGCSKGTLEFVTLWNEPLVCNKDEELVIYKYGFPVFSGPVVSVEPSLENSTQTVELDGWKTRLDEIEIVPPPADKITFGIPGGDVPTAVKAYDVVQWLLLNKIVPDSSPITAGQITGASYSAKLGPSGFVIYANDKLTQVLETLATMDDCIYGVDAERKLYFFPRATAENLTWLQVPIAETIPANWKNSNIAIVSGARIVEDRRGPTHLMLRTRDINAVPGTRAYRLVGTFEDGTRRVGNYYSPNVRHGQGARRLARGLFRRFNHDGLTVEDVNFITGPKRLEPHLGAVTVTSGGEHVTTRLAGRVNVNWADVITGSLSLGENKADIAGGNPLNDPLAGPDDSANDSPQIDTGESSDIDFNDGYDGDGDDLHENEDRDVWTDEPVGLDYGEDTANEDNGAHARGSSLRLAEVTALNGSNYDLDIFKIDGTTVAESRENVEMQPSGAPALIVGQKVLVTYLDATTPKIIGMVPAHGMFLRIAEVKPSNKYDIEVLSPADAETVIATFNDVDPWPAAASFEEGQETLGYWFNGAVAPRPVGGGCCNDNYYFVGQVIKD